MTEQKHKTKDHADVMKPSYCPSSDLQQAETEALCNTTSHSRYRGVHINQIIDQFEQYDPEQRKATYICSLDTNSTILPLSPASGTISHHFNSRRSLSPDDLSHQGLIFHDANLQVYLILIMSLRFDFAYRAAKNVAPAHFEKTGQSIVLRTRNISD